MNVVGRKKVLLYEDVWSIICQYLYPPDIYKVSKLFHGINTSWVQQRTDQVVASLLAYLLPTGFSPFEAVGGIPQVILSGSTVLQAVYGERYHCSDIDFYCTRAFSSRLRAAMLGCGLRHRSTWPNYMPFCDIDRVENWTRSIQLIICDVVDIRDTVKTFDLSILQNAYDGTTCQLGNTDMVMGKMSTLNEISLALVDAGRTITAIRQLANERSPGLPNVRRLQVYQRMSETLHLRLEKYQRRRGITLVR
jgi:hypothetical protein